MILRLSNRELWDRTKSQSHEIDVYKNDHEPFSPLDESRSVWARRIVHRQNKNTSSEGGGEKGVSGGRWRGP